MVYIPSAGDKELKRLNYKLDYCKAFFKYCEKLKEKAIQKGKGVILCGDFNVAYKEGLDNYIPQNLGPWRDK